MRLSYTEEIIRFLGARPSIPVSSRYEGTHMTNAHHIHTRYHVQSTAKAERHGFPYFAHHESVSALWSRKWRPLAAHGIYPFTDGNVDDFDPIFADLDRSCPGDSAVLYRPDEYATPFLPAAQQLAVQAEQALAGGNAPAARDLFLRAAAVYRIARFPVNRSPLGQHAWEQGKAAYEQGGRLLDPPSVAVSVPFTHADPARGDVSAPIPAYLRVPSGPGPRDGWPVVLFICGLDAYRTDHTLRTQAHVERGCAVLSFEIPGTGDCPAAPEDPSSPDRLMSSIIDWAQANAAQYGFDQDKLVARGVSTGGYYAFRSAHTHASRLSAVVSQGGGCHYMFDPEWISAQNQMEYPFALADALAYKFGYRDPDPASAIADYTAGARKFSLLDTGVIGTPACKLLAINGMEDSIFPVEDTLLAATDGDNKDLVVRGNRGHMGNPGAEDIIYQWIDTALADGV